jgi:hypothetical protein
MENSKNKWSKRTIKRAILVASLTKIRGTNANVTLYAPAIHA